MQRTALLKRSTAAVLTAVLASAAVAGCGSSSSSSSASASASSKNLPLEFASCMRSHGVSDYPDPGAPQGTVTTAPPGQDVVDGQLLSEPDSAVTSASDACAKYSPDSQFGPVYNSAQMAQMRQGALALSRCMRARGVMVPDWQVAPGPGGHGVEIGFPKGSAPVAYKSPAYAAANKACSPLFNRTVPKKQG